MCILGGRWSQWGQKTIFSCMLARIWSKEQPMCGVLSTPPAHTHSDSTKTIFTLVCATQRSWNELEKLQKNTFDIQGRMRKVIDDVIDFFFCCEMCSHKQWSWNWFSSSRSQLYRVRAYRRSWLLSFQWLAWGWGWPSIYLDRDASRFNASRFISILGTAQFVELRNSHASHWGQLLTSWACLHLSEISYIWWEHRHAGPPPMLQFSPLLSLVPTWESTTLIRLIELITSIWWPLHCKMTWDFNHICEIASQHQLDGYVEDKQGLGVFCYMNFIFQS